MRKALALVLLWPLAASAKAPPARSIDSIRDEAKATLLIQSILSWYTRTVGEPAIQAETYRGHEALFSRASFDTVAAAQKRASGEQARALTFLKNYLAGEYLGQKTSRFDDEAENAELKSTVRLSFRTEPVPYKQLDLVAAAEKDAAHRQEIERARAEVWKTTLNPILERKEAEAQKLARELGYKSYLELAEEYRLVELGRWIAEGDRFRVATDGLYKELLAERAQRELGLTPDKLHRADLARLRKAPRFEKFFPKELMVPAFRHFLDGIGLDLKTAAGTEIRVDDALHPLKEPRAACYSIRVPGDVRITVKPVGGLDDIETFFHEGGHALHYANTTTTSWELQQLGPYALTEGMAETFGHAWDDPSWLRRYREFVDGWNRAHHTAFPTMTDADITELVHARAFDELYFLRRYGSAKLIYEAALHGGDPSLWRKVYPGPTGDLQALYRDLFSRAYGFPLGDDDALRFRTDVDDLLYAADYTRAFALASLMHEALRAQVGPGWATDKRTGALLKTLYSQGNSLQPDEVAQKLGEKELDLRPTEARLKRLLGK